MNILQYQLYEYTIDDVIDKFHSCELSTMQEMRINYEYIRTIWRINRRVKLYGNL